MSTASIAFSDSVVLSGVSWPDYERSRKDPANHNLKMTYSRGMLEIMSPSQRHERVSYLIGRLIDAWTETYNIDCIGARATTFLRSDLDSGLEPDNCYYIQRERELRGEEPDELCEGPPPDLAIEVEVKQRAIAKLPIYAALNVPEIWCWRDEKLLVLQLSPSGQYEPAEDSRALPGFPFLTATRLLQRRCELGHTGLVAEFRKLIGRRD